MSQLLAVGRTLLSPLTGTARWYNRTAEKHPFTTGVITTGLKTSAADFFAQKVGRRRAESFLSPDAAHLWGSGRLDRVRKQSRDAEWEWRQGKRQSSRSALYH